MSFSRFSSKLCPGVPCYLVCLLVVLVLSFVLVRSCSYKSIIRDIVDISPGPDFFDLVSILRCVFIISLYKTDIE